MGSGIVLVYVDIPVDPGYAWLEDANTIALSRHLDAGGRQRALEALQAEWRRELSSQLDLAS
jgi:hypothetical protein